MARPSQRPLNQDHHLVTVVELINLTRREIFVAVTNELVPALLRRVRRDPSLTVAAWTRDDVIDYRTVEYSMPHGEARRFIEGYVRAIGRSDWKVLVQPGAAPIEAAGPAPRHFHA